MEKIYSHERIEKLRELQHQLEKHVKDNKLKSVMVWTIADLIQLLRIAIDTNDLEEATEMATAIEYLMGPILGAEDCSDLGGLMLELHREIADFLP